MYRVIRNAQKLFELSGKATEELAACAGLSMRQPHENFTDELLQNYSIRIKELCERAMISERMLRYYRTKVPTKQALMAIAVALGLQSVEVDTLLQEYGYCLSWSIYGDIVVRWFLDEKPYPYHGASLLREINTVLEEMGLPLLMTRQS